MLVSMIVSLASFLFLWKYITPWSFDLMTFWLNYLHSVQLDSFFTWFSVKKTQSLDRTIWVFYFTYLFHVSCSCWIWLGLFIDGLSSTMANISSNLEIISRPADSHMVRQTPVVPTPPRCLVRAALHGPFSTNYQQCNLYGYCVRWDHLIDRSYVPSL